MNYVIFVHNISFQIRFYIINTSGKNPQRRPIKRQRSVGEVKYVYIYLKLFQIHIKLGQNVTRNV